MNNALIRLNHRFLQISRAIQSDDISTVLACAEQSPGHTYTPDHPDFDARENFLLNELQIRADVDNASKLLTFNIISKITDKGFVLKFSIADGLKNIKLVCRIDRDHTTCTEVYIGSNDTGIDGVNWVFGKVIGKVIYAWSEYLFKDSRLPDCDSVHNTTLQQLCTLNPESGKRVDMCFDDSRHYVTRRNNKYFLLPPPKYMQAFFKEFSPDMVEERLVLANWLYSITTIAMALEVSVSDKEPLMELKKLLSEVNDSESACAFNQYLWDRLYPEFKNQPTLNWLVLELKQQCWQLRGDVSANPVASVITADVDRGIRGVLSEFYQATVNVLNDGGADNAFDYMLNVAAATYQAVQKKTVFPFIDADKLNRTMCYEISDPQNSMSFYPKEYHESLKWIFKDVARHHLYMVPLDERCAGVLLPLEEVLSNLTNEVATYFNYGKFVTDGPSLKYSGIPEMVKPYFKNLA